MRYLFVLIAFALAPPTRGDVLNVPADYPTIQDALDAASDGDEIMLAPGTYVVDTSLQTFRGFPDPSLVDFTLRSTDPSDPATVAATSVHVTSFSLFDDWVERIEIAGIMFTGDGCRELASAEHLTIRGCVIDAGNGNEQFATEIDGGTFRLVDTLLTGQLASFLNCDPSILVIDGCTFGPRSGDYELFYMNPDEFRLSNMSFVDIDQADEGQILWPGTDLLVMTNMSFTRTWQMMPRGRDMELYNCRFEEIVEPTSDYLFEFGVRGFVAEDCEFIDLASADVGAVEAQNIIIRRSRFERCSGRFGVVHALGTNLVVEDSDFIENNARVAAAIESHGPVTLERCRFLRHRSSDQSLGTEATVFCYGSPSRDYASPIVIRDCEFRDNADQSVSTFNGWQEIECLLNSSYALGGSLTVERCQFIGNGGGLLVSPFNGPDETPFATFIDCEIVGQQRAFQGFGNTVFQGCTFANNGNEPGRMWQFLGSAGKFTNCVINHDFDDGQNSSLFIGTGAVSHTVLPEAIPGATDSTTLAPLFVRPPSDGGDGWGDDPSTPGIDESLNDDFGDLRLQPASPAIDAGSNDFFMPGDTDLDGNPRLADDPGIPGASVDIGAYEFQGSTCLADVNQDGMVTPADYNAWILAFNQNSPLADQNRTGDVTPADYNAWILNYNQSRGSGCP